MKIDKLTFLPHRLKRRGRWQTASYSTDYVDVFYVTIYTDDGVSGIGAGSVVPNSRSDPFGAGLEAVKAAVTEIYRQRPIADRSIVQRAASSGAGVHTA